MKWCLLLLVVVVSVEGAFMDTATKRSASLSLFASSKDHVLRAGGGVPVVPSGDRLLFDPEREGKLSGSGSLNQRITLGLNYQQQEQQQREQREQTTDVLEAQHWLEDIGVPINFAKNNKPVEATVLGRMPLIGEDAPGDIQHVLLKLPSGMHYVEGQSISVIPPGRNVMGKPHAPRLYSIASTRYGDLLDGQTVSLCVRRAVHHNEYGVEDESKKGVCSNFLCDAMPGQKVSVAGPVGKTMLLPTDPTKDIILVGTGTGVAPFRAFLHRLFMEHTVARHMYQGQAWLILGVPVTSGLLYHEEFQAMQTSAGAARLRIDYAISREMSNQINGGKMYVQHVLAEQADTLLAKLQNGAHIYFCGLKGMMPGIQEALEQVCQARGLDFSTQLKKWKSNNQWHVEVY